MKKRVCNSDSAHKQAEKDMFSISMRDQGCDVKIIGVKIEETHLVTILARGEEKKKRVTQIRRWGYI